jgi:hypothetical protein
MERSRRHPGRATFSANSDRMANDGSDHSRVEGFDWKPMTDQAPNLSAEAEKVSLLAGLTVGLAYSTFASFVANALTPVTGYLVEADSFRRSVSGRYQEVFSVNGAISTVLTSLIVFVLVWWSMRVILEHWQREDWGRIGSRDRCLSDGPLLIPVITAPLAPAANR